MNWNKALHFFKKHGFTSRFCSDMYDGLLTLLDGKVTFDIMKFDEYLHYLFGNYEEEGKTLNDMFERLFDQDALTAKAYFGIYEYHPMPQDFIDNFIKK